MSEEDILFEEVSDHWGQKTGVIRLSRDSAMNALSLSMIEDLHEMLLRWQCDEAIKCVVIYSNSPRAFCAGGDVKALYQHREQLSQSPHPFFEKEYTMNHQLFHFGKPYIALLDGLTMGGGVGVSLHGSHPIAGDNMAFAMPEARIGFFVDIGSAYHLSRLPQNIGTWMALTGLSLTAADAMGLGLVAAVVAQEQFDSLRQALYQADMREAAQHVVATVVANYAESPGYSDVLRHAELIDSHFSHGSIDDIIASVNADNDPWLQRTQEALAYNSPLSLHVILQHMLQAKMQTFDEVISSDFRLVHHFLADHDFMEGVRAAVVDKDQQPRWQPSSLAGVTCSMVAKYFEPMGPLLLG